MRSCCSVRKRLLGLGCLGWNPSYSNAQREQDAQEQSEERVTSLVPTVTLLPPYWKKASKSTQAQVSGSYEGEG